MKKRFLIALFGVIVLAACSGESPNSDLYDKSNPDYASTLIPANDPTFDQFTTYDWYDEERGEPSGFAKYDGPAYINLAVQWYQFIDNQTMPGVYFPHDLHRLTLRDVEFFNKDNQSQIFVSGCVTCHSRQDGSANRLFMTKRFLEKGTKLSTPDITNEAHEFCWTTCHEDMAEPNSAPKRNNCASCHRVENTRK